MTKRPPKPVRKPGQPNDLRGQPATGRIVKIQTGQGHGFIRLPNGREIYFHRSDLRERALFNDLRLGDAVRFEVLEDSVSGARALRVTRKEKQRRAGSEF